MNDLPALLHREAVYLWYYFTVQLEQILGWWVLGMVVGSAVSVFAQGAIRRALLSLRGAMLAVRLISCFLCGVAAGALVRALCKKKSFFNFRGFAEPENRDTDPNPLRRYGKNLWRNVRATTGFFFLGVLLSAAFQRYVPAETMTALFGGNEALGVLMAATVGVPLYACGGGTIPLLQQWLLDGMRPGSAAAFLLTGPSTKITNLGALKIVLGWKHFLLYLAFVMGFSLAAGLIVNAIL